MTTHPQDPAVVGPFAIQGRLGRGAMGAVYLARSPGGRLVAVKVVRDELAGDSGFRARFAREIDAARRVSGAFTAPVVDADPSADRPWLATEYLPGPTLQKAIETSGPLPPDAVRSLASGLAEALAAIHASGLVHRDLKPSNIVLTGNGPRVIDFGIARALEEASLTATGMVIGTPGYLSPEQITGTGVGPASDVFALGAVLVFAASGRGPYATGSPASLLHRIVNEQPQLPPLPEPVADVVRRCLARDPAHRPTPAEVLRILGPTTTNPPTTLLPPPTKVLPPTKVPQPQLVEATFATSRTRPTVFAAISTFLWLAFIPADPQVKALHPVLSSLSALISLAFFCLAVRYWILALRPKVVFRLSSAGLTVNRRRRQATVPWQGVTRLRVGGDMKRPWLVAWLEPPYQNQLPVSRHHHGGLRLYPIAHGGSPNNRRTQVNELRAALNWYAPNLHDKTF
ncbi:serine/threonine-protein kinase [Kribbella speibonae]|uniref:Serine/threonine protein kinase n=1 Tax=Kribbella speibonae TaxID=1572660 RepID=A0A4V2M3E1_9ACTN|nr:serine/threonine-protein kinase [Kribbella speibonae]TCC31702.1 serine/threonine protein kinase [Kribbella speibonae]